MASSGIQCFLYFPGKILIRHFNFILFELKGNLCLPWAHWEFEIYFKVFILLSFVTVVRLRRTDVMRTILSL